MIKPVTSQIRTVIPTPPKPIVTKASTPKTPVNTKPANNGVKVNLNKSASNNIGIYNNKGNVPSSGTPTSTTVAFNAPADPVPDFTNPNITYGKGSVVSTGGNVSISILNSESGYDNQIYYSTDGFKTSQYLGIDNQTGTYNLGNIAKGTQIDFGIANWASPSKLTSGDASANFDNYQHAKSATLSDGSTIIGFEDLVGGGDQDFNDAIISVKTTPDAPQDSTDKTNNSGLADGSNPGSGSVNSKSDNPGVNNPNNSGSDSSKVSSSPDDSKSPKSSSSDDSKSSKDTTRLDIDSKLLKDLNDSSKDSKSSKDTTRLDIDSKLLKDLNDSSKDSKSSKDTTRLDIDSKLLKDLKDNSKDSKSSKDTTRLDIDSKLLKDLKDNSKDSKSTKNTTGADLLSQVLKEIDNSKNSSKSTKSTDVNISKSTTTFSGNTNQSGLADGTNPGNGANKTQSNNTGVNNPNSNTKVGKK